MTTQTNFADMGKSELRAACKAAGMTGYSKLSVGDMRAELQKAADTIYGFEAHGLAHCPHCDVHLSNGVGDGEKTVYGCLGCGEDFGPTKSKQADRHSGTGLKIEKDRPERNGIKRPSVGGKCRAIWDFLDGVVAKGEQPTAKLVRAQAETAGWNANNAVIEFYQWRKFNA
jgi:hypothetical protein